MRTLPILAVFLLISCGRDQCDAELLSVEPVVGSGNVPRTTSIVFELDEVKGDESITLRLDEETVAGDTRIEGTRVIFEPDEPLRPDERYEAELDGSCGFFTAFTTAPAGANGADPVDDPEELVGNTYLVDLRNLDSVEPELFKLPLAQVEGLLALGVDDIEADELHALLTMIPEPGVQDLCTPTSELPAAEWDNPRFSLQSALPFPLGDDEVAFNKFGLSGRFASDGSHIQNLVIEAQVDLRTMDDPAGTCFALALAGSPCVPCLDGTPLCVDIVLKDNRVDKYGKWTLIPRSAEQIATDPSCN